MSSTDEKTITKKTTLRVTVGDPWPSAKAGARHDGPPGWGTLSPRTREVVGGLAVSIYAERSGDPLPELAAMFTKALRGAWAPGDIPDAPVIESTIEHGSWRRADLECHGPVAYSATIDVDVFSALARQNHMRVAGK